MLGYGGTTLPNNPFKNYTAYWAMHYSYYQKGWPLPIYRSDCTSNPSGEQVDITPPRRGIMRKTQYDKELILIF
jgi:hypothetical protein